jgi:uncharacterized RDD family membrane protein YckC
VTARSASQPYAGFVTRAVGLVIDVVIIDVLTVVGVAIVSLVLRTIVPGDHALGLPEALTAGAVWLISVGGYFVGFWSLVGRTPGMRLMRLEVRSTDGGDIGWGRASLRFLGLVAAAIPLGAGFLLALVDDRRQALQDKVASTVVLYTVARVRGVFVAAVPDPAAERHEAAEPAGEVIEGTVVPPGARPA